MWEIKDFEWVNKCNKCCDTCDDEHDCLECCFTKWWDCDTCKYEKSCFNCEYRKDKVLILAEVRVKPGDDIDCKELSPYTSEYGLRCPYWKIKQ